MNRRKKILVISESIDVEDSSGSKANVALIKNLQAAGYDLLVYHYTRKEIQIGSIPCHNIPENRKSLYFFLSRFERYLRLYFKISLNKTIEKKFGFSFTLINDRNSIITALKKENSFIPDLVLTLSKGGSFRPHHALLKMSKWHSKWMAYIHDPYPMHLYPPPYTWTEPGHKQKNSFMEEVFNKAKYLAFPSKLLMIWMFNFFPNNKSKGLVIPHQISDLKKLSNYLPTYFQTNNFTVVHAGNLLWGRDPVGLIEGYKLFIKDNPAARITSQLLILGGKNHYTPLLNQLSKGKGQIYISKDSIPYEEVQAIQNSCSVNVILEAKSSISPFLPGKFPHCIIAGRPILLLGPSYSESKRLLGEDYPYWAEIDEVEKIALILKVLYEKWKNDPEDLKSNYKAMEYYLSPENLGSQLKTII